MLMKKTISKTYETKDGKTVEVMLSEEEARMHDLADD